MIGFIKGLFSNKTTEGKVAEEKAINNSEKSQDVEKKYLPIEESLPLEEKKKIVLERANDIIEGKVHLIGYDKKREYIGLSLRDREEIVKQIREEQCVKIDELNSFYRSKIDSNCSKNKLKFEKCERVDKVSSSSEESIQIKIQEGKVLYCLNDANVLSLTNSQKAEKLHDFWSMLEDTYKCNDLKELITKISGLDVDLLNELYRELRNYKAILKGTQYYRNIHILRGLIKPYLYREGVIKKVSRGAFLGENGEKAINNHLELYSDEIINLENVTLKVDGKSAENDNILITRYGVFVLEVKNIGSSGKFSIHIKPDGRWEKVTEVMKNVERVGEEGKIIVSEEKVEERETIDFDATAQNVVHAAVVKKVINRALNRNVDNLIDVNHFVVIANNVLDIDNESKQTIIRKSGIYDHMSSCGPVLSYSEMKEIERVILESQEENKGYPMVDFKNEVLENFLKIKEVAQYLNINNESIRNVLSIIEEWHKKRKEETERYLNENYVFLDYYDLLDLTKDKRKEIKWLYENYSRNTVEKYNYEACCDLLRATSSDSETRRLLERMSNIDASFQYLIEGDRMMVKVEKPRDKTSCSILNLKLHSIMTDENKKNIRYCEDEKFEGLNFVYLDTFGLGVASNHGTAFYSKTEKEIAVSGEYYEVDGKKRKRNYFPMIHIHDGEKYIGEYKEVQVVSIDRQWYSYVYAKVVD